LALLGQGQTGLGRLGSVYDWQGLGVIRLAGSG